jgi:serine/threonine protein kinase
MEVKVADFGVARLIHTDEPMSVIAGTYGYIAPGQHHILVFHCYFLLLFIKKSSYMIIISYSLCTLLSYPILNLLFDCLQNMLIHSKLTRRVMFIAME